MMSHTTGPWKYFPDDPEASITGYVIETETALEIAVTGFGFGPQEDIANARLIAAAPNLLSALVSLINSMPESEIDIARECIGHTNASVWLHWRDNALAAISLATAQEKE